MSTLAATEAKAEVADPLAWLTGGRVLALWGAYFLVQTVLRVLVSNTAELDESAQVLAAQDWQWGYGSDGPLYTWLQILSFRLFGTNILALSFLKNALLFAAGAFTWRAAYEISRDQKVAAVALLALLLFPQITWESQRDLTHSVLATSLAAATFLLAVQIHRSPSAGKYLLLGLCVGLGVLSKYSYAVFAVALALAALTLPSLRPLLLDRRCLLTCGVVLLVTVPYFRWVLLSPELAFRRAHEVVQKTEGQWVTSRIRGLFSVIECGFMLVGVLAAACAAAFWKAPAGQGRPIALPAERWVIRTVIVVLGICLLVVLSTGIKLKDRWFQPLVFLLAIGAALALRDRLTRRRTQRFATLAAVAGLAALALLPGIPLTAAITGRPTRLNAPYSQFGAQLMGSVTERTAIVASTRWVGGNLKLWFPDRDVLAPEAVYVRAAVEAPWLVVWDASKSLQPPAALTDFVVTRKGVDLRTLAPLYIEAPYKYAPRKTMKLGLVVLKPLMSGR